MPDQIPFASVQDANGREAAIRHALATSAPMPRDPVRTRILQTAGGGVAVLAALQFVTSMRQARRA